MVVHSAVNRAGKPTVGSNPAPGAIFHAGVALVGEHLIRNEDQVGSTPITSSISSPSSRGPGHFVLSEGTRIRLPVGTPIYRGMGESGTP